MRFIHPHHFYLQHTKNIPTAISPKMLLQSALSQSPLHHRHHHHHHNNNNYASISSSSSRSHTLSFKFPSGFSNSTHQKTTNPVFKCSSISKVHNYNTVDYENKPYVKWKDAFQRVFKIETEVGKGCVSALNQWEKEGNTIIKWEVNKIVRELRKRKRYHHALAVFEWMNIREDRFLLTASDTAVQLDLIAKVRGISDAEKFFFALPDTLKDDRAYGALLNGYVRSKNKEKAESLQTQMKTMGYCKGTLSYNVMMTLYMGLKDYDKVESVVSEMIDDNIPLDLYTYNIWISSLGSQGSLEKMEQVVEQMNQDNNINPNWSSYTTRATMYIKFGQLEKAEQCLKVAENRLTGRNRIPYHYIISLYGSIGNKEEVKRIWNIYRTVFPFIPNLGFYIAISAFIKCGDIEEAENLYEEWLSIKQRFDTRVCNLLMLWYVRNGYFEKAENLFDEIGEHGGKPMPSSWEILATARISEGRVSEAVSYLGEAVTCLEESTAVSGLLSWKPRPVNVNAILELCEQKGDLESKEILLELMKKLSCFEDEGYMSCIPRLNEGKNMTNAGGRMNAYDDDDEGADLLLSQLESS